MKIHNFDQGTKEWIDIRLGKATASNFKKIMAKGKGLTRKTHMVELAAETLTRLPTPFFANEAVRWGNEKEPEARVAYEIISGNKIELIGFIEHSDYVGMSPDGLQNEKGAMEIKCPTTKVHLETFLKNEMPTEHMAQVQGVMWGAERDWCDYVSFDPRLPESCNFFCQRIMRDDAYIANLEDEVNEFVAELNELVHKLS